MSRQPTFGSLHVVWTVSFQKFRLFLNLDHHGPTRHGLCKDGKFVKIGWKQNITIGWRPQITFVIDTLHVGDDGFPVGPFGCPFRGGIYHHLGSR